MIKLKNYFEHCFTIQLGTGKGWLEMLDKKRIKNLGKKTIIIFALSSRLFRPSCIRFLGQLNQKGDTVATS